MSDFPEAIGDLVQGALVTRAIEPGAGEAPAHTHETRCLNCGTGLCLALAGCLLVPGHFTSSLDIRRDGAFTYRYSGEIKVLGLVELARMQAQQAAANATFEPRCWGAPSATSAPAAPAAAPSPPAAAPSPPAAAKDASLPFGRRTCTDTEAAQQRKLWEDNQKLQTANAQHQAQQMSALFGGIDPSSPGAAEELAARLRRQAGWTRVDYKGDGVFEVEFAAAGRLTHDFAFPTVEKFPAATAFLTIYRHADGTLRIDAPGFAGGVGNQATAALMAIASKAGGDSHPGELPAIDGHFTLTTDATILANNTEEGPQGDPAGQRLEWAITPRADSAPTALLRLAPAARQGPPPASGPGCREGGRDL